MLNGLLTREECAKCQICCTFDSYDLWETPVITYDVASMILQDCDPEQKFITKENHLLLKLDREPDRDLYFCTVLDRSKGCKLGENKPFDCKIWPFRLMKLDEKTVITLSPVCPVVNKRSMEEIVKKCSEISDVIFEEGRKHPEYIKKYIDGYPVIAVEKE